MMNSKSPHVEPFVKLPRHVIERILRERLSLAAMRLLQFLMREHLRRGGRANGCLEAPHRQLVAIGISAGLVSGAILELENAQLVQCHRRGQRMANYFELTWLPQSRRSGALDLAPRTEAGLRTDARAELPPEMEADRKNLPHEAEARLPPVAEADRKNLPPDTEAELPPEAEAEP
jgi:hypothetical protein